MGQTVQAAIRKFDVTNITPGTVSVIIGKRTTGKTTLVNDIVRHNKNDTNVINYTNRETLTNEYFENFYNQHINTIIPSFLILDDCFYEADLRKYDSLIKVIKYAKELNTTILMVLPYAMRLSGDILSKINYVFIFKETNYHNLDRLYNDYGKQYGQQTFEQFLKELLNESYNCMVICNDDDTDIPNTFVDRTFWYKASVV